MTLPKLLILLLAALSFSGCADDPEDQEFFYNSFLPSHRQHRTYAPPSSSDTAPAQPPPAGS